MCAALLYGYRPTSSYLRAGAAAGGAVQPGLAARQRWCAGARRLSRAPEQLQQQALTSETVATARGGYLNLCKPAHAQVALVAALHALTAPRQHAQRPSHRRSAVSVELGPAGWHGGSVPLILAASAILTD